MIDGPVMSDLTDQEIPLIQEDDRVLWDMIAVIYDVGLQLTYIKKRSDCGVMSYSRRNLRVNSWEVQSVLQLVSIEAPGISTLNMGFTSLTIALM
jgi:hypothetical protein